MEREKMRCHISIIIENAGSLLGVLLAFGVKLFDDMIENISNINRLEGKTYIIGFVLFIAVFLLVLLINLNRWYKTTIWIENGTLIVEQNTLNKKKNTYTIKNISNIDMEQNLFERMVGTYKIKIDTNSSALADKTDIKIVFSKQKAIVFKQEIMSSMGQWEEKSRVDDENVSFDVVCSVKDILLHCFFTVNIFSVIFLSGCFIGFFVAMSFADNSYTINDFISDALGGFAAITIAVVSAFYSLIKGFFKYYNFKARRRDNRIHLIYGSFRKNINTIPVDKINGIKLIQPFLSRIFGRYQVEVINIGTGDEKDESANILLSCTYKEVKKYMAVLLPEFENFIDKPIKKQSKKYFLHMAYDLVVIVLILITVFSVFNYFLDFLPIWVEGLIGSGLICLCILCYIFSYYASGYYIGQDYIIVANGIFTKTYSMIRLCQK
jgi:putative membrane protein